MIGEQQGVRRDGLAGSADVGAADPRAAAEESARPARAPPQRFGDDVGHHAPHSPAGERGDARRGE
jgi:hypothetical protein